jgi:putative nucleotidyltransferase with HDIG domain
MAAVRLPRPARVYVAIVVALGTAAIGHALAGVTTGSHGYHWLLLMAMTLLSGPFSIKVPSVHATISVSETFVFASALLFGPAPAVLTVALDGLVVSLFSKHRSAYRTAFNVAEPAISVWVGAQIFYALSGVTPLMRNPVPLQEVVLPLFAMTTAYFMLNSWLTAFAVGFEARVPPLRFLRSYLPTLSLNFFVTFCLAVMLVVNAGNINLATVAVLLPILVMSYASSKTSMARVEDANRHLAELNKLYLSTVETLAMAIDAKDQITHGHIRRVQLQAVALAKALGVKDDVELKAIEAAALLHDLGKLAVPEHILNKPGALTPSEFEQMKRHASVGANILSTIDFPYPVTPIVRHHHESWDGAGYPDGLKAEEIPLGARILSVVDCFDALTSDRPYRRRLTDQQALDILIARSGTMYDPRVVDTFITIYETLPRDVEPGDKQSSFAEMVAAPAAPSRPAHQAHPPVDRPVISGPTAAAIENAGEHLSDSLAEIGPVLHRWVQAIADDAMFVLFAYDVRSDSLEARYVSAAEHAAVRGLRIPLGERLTGWVGANRQRIVNSDPALDFADVPSPGLDALKSCLSVPVLADSALVGVLSIYAPRERGFSDQQAQMAELLGIDLVPRLCTSKLLEGRESPDERTSSDQGSGRPVLRVAHRRAGVAV